MKRFEKLFLSGAAVLALSLTAAAQTALTQTTLVSAINASQTSFKLASTAGITPNATDLFIDNELMAVYAVNGNTVTVGPRGAAGTKAFAHIAGAGVLAGPPQAFIAYDPSGACSPGQGLFQYAPVVNIANGNQWLCSSVLNKVAPGFGNTADPALPTSAVASASAITPSGPLFHVTGTAAISTINLPVGFDPKGGGSFTIIADGVFSWGTGGNIAVASGTVVVGRSYTFTYDPQTQKFYPSTQ